MKNPNHLLIILSLTGLLLGEPAVLAYVVAEIPSGQVVHHQIQILTILECVVHVDNVRIMELGEDLALVHDGLETSLGEYACFGHLLHSVLLLGLLPLDLPHLPKTSLPDAVLVREVAFRES